jgi:hypothetical protein
MRIKFSDRKILISEFSLYELILLYLQIRWLLMERNTVYTRWNVGFNTRLIDSTHMLEVRYDVSKWSVCYVFK